MFCLVVFAKQAKGVLRIAVGRLPLSASCNLHLWISEMKLLLVPELLVLPSSCQQPVPTIHSNRDTSKERLSC